MNHARCGHYPATQPKPLSLPKLARESGVWFEILSLRWIRGRSGSTQGIRCANRRIPMVVTASDRMQWDHGSADGKKLGRITHPLIGEMPRPVRLRFPS